jgi:hypothetical protein
METQIAEVMPVPLSAKLIHVLGAYDATYSSIAGTTTARTYKFKEYAYPLMPSSAPLGASDSERRTIRCPYCNAEETLKVRQDVFAAIPHSCLREIANRLIIRRLFCRIILRASRNSAAITAGGFIGLAFGVLVDESRTMPAEWALALLLVAFLSTVLLVTTIYAIYCYWIFRTHSIIVRLGENPGKLYAQVSIMNGVILFRQIVGAQVGRLVHRRGSFNSGHRFMMSETPFLQGTHRVEPGVDKRRIAESFFAQGDAEKIRAHVFGYHTARPRRSVAPE